MLNKTTIPYADFTWNPIVGCRAVSEGCEHCYARELHEKRRKARLNGACLPDQYLKEFEQPQLFQERLMDPWRREKPATIFVCNMSDLFYEGIPDEWISTVMRMMRQARWHQFLVLTKRPERMQEVLWTEKPAFNIWLGVTVETRAQLYRLDILDRMTGWRKWVSVEPMLGEFGVGILGAEPLGFVVGGCESGPKRRPTEKKWLRLLRDSCKDFGYPFMLKQMEVDGKVKQLPFLDGAQHNMLPRDYL